MAKCDNDMHLQERIMLPLETVQKIYALVPNSSSKLNIQNIDLYQTIFNSFTSKYDAFVKHFNIAINLQAKNKLLSFCFYLNYSDWKIAIPMKEIATVDFESFLFGKLTFWDFLRSVVLSKNVFIGTQLSTMQIEDALSSWNRYVSQLGYNEEKHLLNFSDAEIRQALNTNNIVWYYGSSCSGKSYMGIREVQVLNASKIAYNPCFSHEYEYELVKLLLCYGENISFLLDDLQCDVEKAKELFLLISSVKSSFADRNIHVFLISWVSLIADKNFSAYQTMFSAIESDTFRYISQLQKRISDEKLKKVCGSNLALLNVAGTVITKRNVKDPERFLFEAFIKTKDDNKLLIIYRLCVLGTYEYLIPVDSVHMQITSSDITTIKIINKKYYVGHKEICRFLSAYISSHNKELGLATLPEQDKIIYDYIQGIESVNQWKSIKQLIGEQGEESLQNVSPIWKGLHCFEQEIASQTHKDPTWGNTPSSMYFVLKVATLLGVVSEYKTVLNNFCSKFVVDGSKVVVKYDEIATTNDFEQIKRRMIEEDCSNSVYGYERGVDFDCNRAHKNWLLGLIVGLKNELVQFGHEDLYETAVSELFAEQDSSGGWYPKRVPWISARVLIGLSQAGFTASNDKVSKGVSFLLRCLGTSDHWNAHTGNWNTPYETSSLCLEAIFNSKTRLMGSKKNAVNKVIQYLLNTKTDWMKDDKVVDGSATACCLLKNYDYSPDLIEYIQKLCDQRIYNIVAKNSELNLSEQQSCETTQVAWYVMDFCWDVLYTHLPDLLNQFVTRSLQNKDNMGGNTMANAHNIFISYSENSQSTIKRIQKVSAYLRNSGYSVWCYADEPLGSNMVSFMQNAPMADVILIMGSKRYKEKSLKIRSYTDKGSGVFFENLILSQMFIQNTMDKIIPIAFEQGTSFEDSFPPPFSTNKGISGYRVTDSFLENLVRKIEEKLNGGR